MRALLIALVLAAPATARSSEISQPIVGGEPVPPGKWPDAVAVVGEAGTCTGTLVAPDVVITAGHCAGIRPQYVVANTNDYADGGEAAEVTRITAHPQWATTYDVAVVELATPLAVTPRAVGTACTLDAVGAGTPVHLVGFGATDPSGHGSTSVLHEAVAPVIDPDCSAGDGCMPAVAPGGELVAGGDGTDSCFGDSGGPVYLDTERGPVVIAAVSRGLAHAAAPCGGGGIYVRTDKLVAWIEATAGKPIAHDTCGDAAAPPPEAGGCSAGGSASLGIGLVLLVIVRGNRRRRA